MATTKIRAVKATLSNTIIYIINPPKMANYSPVGVVNCRFDTTVIQMADTKSAFGKHDGR